MSQDRTTALQRGNRARLCLKKKKKEKKKTGLTLIVCVEMVNGTDFRAGEKKRAGTRQGTGSEDGSSAAYR